MRKLPTVSVVLTTFNRASSLRTTIQSVLTQSFGDFELLVCDDCSSDDTGEVVAAAAAEDSRVRYIRHAANLGMPGNLNAGIVECRGELIANLHDGDVYDQNLLSSWVAALRRCPGAGFVFNGYRYLHSDGSVAGTSSAALAACTPGHQLIEGRYFRSALFISPAWGTCMVRRSSYDKVGLFDARYGFWSDVDMWMRIAEEFEVAFVDEPLISLPSRSSLPRQKGTNRREEQLMLERMFLQARRRHYQQDRPRLMMELAKHSAFVIFARVGREAQAQAERIPLLKPFVRRDPF